MDRNVVTELVEDYWRTIIPAMQNGGPAAQLEAANRFEQRVKEVSAQLPPIESLSFTQQIDAERERLMAEYSADPVALKRRLKIKMGIDDPRPNSRQSSSQNGLGNLAVRTAVRATIWESIWALFRNFR